MPKNDKGAAAWERQQGESSQAYEAFSIYRDLGDDRTLRAVWSQLGKSRGLIERWSSRYNWGERVRQWENSLQKEAYKKAVSRTAEMQTRHIKTAVLMQKKAVEALDALNIKELSAQDIVRLIREGSKLERETRGEDPAIVAQEKREHEATEGGESGLADAIMEAWKDWKGGDESA